MKTRVIGSALLTLPGGVLLLRRARDYRGIKAGKGFWELPGGTVQPGEKIPDAARREVNEEAGISLDQDSTLSGAVNYVVEDGGKSVHRAHVIYAFGLNGDTKVKLGKEHDQFKVIQDPAELEKMRMVDDMKTYLQKILSRGA
jgi:8-oxo-dGTP pyrophosphatase MutT (NUDIX family)